MQTLHQDLIEPTLELSLNSFLEQWDRVYAKELEKIPLFNEENQKSLDSSQKSLFIKIFYHIRGHFHVLLWYLGNFSENPAFKKMVLHNIAEEFGEKGKSHEQLYFDFANQFDIDLSEEFIHQNNYHAFAKEFNMGHLSWFQKSDWIHKVSGFSAYERLDNIDYNNLLKLAKNIGATGNALNFFIVHSHADHFDRTTELLNNAWETNSQAVKDSFNFIKNHQIIMWKALSSVILDA